jgi:hypothetical protein
MSTSGTVHITGVTRALKRRTCPTKMALLLGFAFATMGLTPQASVSMPALSIEWSARLGTAMTSERVRYALCPDSSVVAYASPTSLYKVSPDGNVEVRRELPALQSVRSIDCSDTLRVFQVTNLRGMQIIELSLADLTHIRSVDVVGSHGTIAGGLRVLNGEPWLLLGEANGALLGRLEGDSIGRRIGMELPRPGRQSNSLSIVVPAFHRQDTNRYVYLQTYDYSVAEFDAEGLLQRLWRRDDADFSSVRAPLVPGGVVEDESVSGAAMLPGGQLAVQVVKQRRDGGASYIEILDRNYSVMGTWALPTKGILFDADATGSLYFGYASRDTFQVWKARLSDK